MKAAFILCKYFMLEVKNGKSCITPFLFDRIYTLAKNTKKQKHMHKLPADLHKAINSDSIAKNMWADITPLAKNEWICWVTSAKKDETRKRRIRVGLSKMHKGMRRPCCWAGCPHRG